MKNFNVGEIQTSKQFNKALSEVFTGIAGRNNQLQQLLVIAVNEAARESGGQVTNNLSWLTSVLVMAEDTKGINATRIASYVKEVLCCKTVSWNNEKRVLCKTQGKTLEYNTAPETTWMDYGRANKVKDAFDYEKKLTSLVTRCLDEEKGSMSTAEVLKAVMAGGVSSVDLGLALQFLADEANQQVAEQVPAH